MAEATNGAATTLRASDRAYVALRDDILSWRLEPGTVLGEVEQSTRLGVSRTPLREAFARLVGEGLVEPATQPGRGGVVVAELGRADIVELFEARQALEERAATLAAARRERPVFETLREEFAHARELIDDERRDEYLDLVRRFDEAVDVATGNAYLVTAIRQLRTHLARVRSVAHDDPARLAAAADEHRLMAEAIAAGDAELARSATRVHLHQSLRTILASIDARRLNPAAHPTPRRTA